MVSPASFNKWRNSHEDDRIRSDRLVSSGRDRRPGRRRGRRKDVLGSAGPLSLLSPHSWQTRDSPMRWMAISLIVALPLVVGAVGSVRADRWPADLWERL